MVFGSGLGQCRAFLLLASSCLGTGPEAEAVIAGLEDVAAVGQAVEERRGHLGVAKDRGPFAEAEVGGDDDAGAFGRACSGDGRARRRRWRRRVIAQLVEDHEVGACQGLCDLAGLSLGLLLFERIDQLDRREEAGPLSMMLHGLDAECSRDVRLAGAGPGECQIFCVWVNGSMLPERSKDDDDIQRTAGRATDGLQAG